MYWFINTSCKRTLMGILFFQMTVFSQTSIYANNMNKKKEEYVIQGKLSNGICSLDHLFMNIFTELKRSIYGYKI